MAWVVLGRSLDAPRVRLNVELGSELENELGSELGNELGSELKNEVGSELKNELGSEWVPLATWVVK